MKLINRPEYIDQLKLWQNQTNLIKIVTGVRRSGKSKLFELFQEYLKTIGFSKNQMITINLEEGEEVRKIGLKRNQKTKLLENWELLLDFINSKMLKNKKTFIFLDEIQWLSDWQVLANTLRLKKNVDLYLTGSNAYMFSSEMSSLLGGRYIEIKLQPLSFKEFILFKKGKSKGVISSIDILDKYRNYITQSGFPETIEFNGNQHMINTYLVDSVYRNTVQKDIIQRFNISNPIRLDEIIRFMFDNIGNATSLRKVQSKLKTDAKIDISTATLNSYVKGLLDSYLMYKCEEYDLKGKRILESDAKYYVVDLGLKNALIGRSDIDLGHALENIVYLELIRRGNDVKMGRVQTKPQKIGNKIKYKTIEIDFVAKRASGVIEYYQVAWSVLGNEETLRREYASLEAIKDNYPKYLLTMDPGNGEQNGIKRLNVINWLIGTELDTN